MGVATSKPAVCTLQNVPDPIQMATDIARTLGPYTKARIVHYAILAPFLTVRDTQEGGRLVLPDGDTTENDLIAAFREVAQDRSWALSVPGMSDGALLQHSHTGWSMARHVSDRDIQDALLMLATIPPTDVARDAIPWASVPDFPALRELTLEPQRTRLESLMVPFVLQHVLASGGDITEVSAPMVPVRLKLPKEAQGRLKPHKLNTKKRAKQVARRKKL